MTSGTMQLRRADERGQTRWGWLDSRHTFSFGEYYDAAHQGFRALRVINDDRVAPGQGFGAHPHRDMEILSFVLEGALEHKDSSGGGGVIRPGEVQFMRAGRGVVHSEFNHSKTEAVHFLQIWVVPDRTGLPAGYDQRRWDEAAAGRGFVLLASRDGREDTIQIQQDVDLYVSRLSPGDRRTQAIAAGRHAWLHVARGTVDLNGQPLGEGDGVSMAGPADLSLTGRGEGEVLLFDLA